MYSTDTLLELSVQLRGISALSDALINILQFPLYFHLIFTVFGVILVQTCQNLTQNAQRSTLLAIM